MAKSKKTGAHGGARKGAGRKPALTIAETWEAGSLCDLLERRQIEAWAFRATYDEKRLSGVAKAQKALRELPVELRSGGDAIEDSLFDVQAAFEEVGAVSDDVMTAVQYKPKKIFPRTVEFKRSGRRPKGIAARERVIEIVARYLRRNWRRDVSVSAIRMAWKASRRQWRKAAAEDDPTRDA